MKRAIVMSGLFLGTMGCTIGPSNADPDKLRNLDACSPSFQQAFEVAVKNNDKNFCLGNLPNPEFIEDGLGGYCFLSHSSDPADFSVLNETSVVTDCVDSFAQETNQVENCQVLQGTDYPTSGIGATAYNNCVLNFATATADLGVCTQLEKTEPTAFDLPDDQECIKLVAWTTHNPQLCHDFLQGTDVYELCLSQAENKD